MAFLFFDKKRSVHRWLLLIGCKFIRVLSIFKVSSLLFWTYNITKNNKIPGIVWDFKSIGYYYLLQIT
tara:strand:- start:14645 stop:14848 length:204 start_codon:yes stop_codon:yes gene_type:complete